jgi:hypothetical protein
MLKEPQEINFLLPRSLNYACLDLALMRGVKRRYGKSKR